ncbi:MAG TPA: DUF6308 family protein [Anaerolineales bacterium]|nr:DUF6308 family protein [Anaerolineales bacterium]HRQ93061.1 DUF6308 family protein [Anaerolineales bacterium]
MTETYLQLGGETKHMIHDPGKLLLGYRDQYGADYYDYQPVTDPGVLVAEDLAVTLAVNSNAGWRAFRSVKLYAAEVDLAGLPHRELQETTPEEREAVADLIFQIVEWPGFGSSLATKLLHKKRPALIPMLDNQSIFGAYANSQWPAEGASWGSVTSRTMIRSTLESIYQDVSRETNVLAWEKMKRLEPAFSRIELFDCIWWMYFRNHQPRA